MAYKQFTAIHKNTAVVEAGLKENNSAYILSD